MSGILFIAFNLVVCDFLKFYWWKMLHSYANFSFIILSLRMTAASVEMLEIEDGLNKTWIKSKFFCFVT